MEHRVRSIRSFENSNLNKCKFRYINRVAALAYEMGNANKRRINIEPAIDFHVHLYSNSYFIKIGEQHERSIRMLEHN